MTLKKCCGCGQMKTTKNSTLLGRASGMLWFNCECKTTFVLKPKNWSVEMFDEDVKLTKKKAA